MIILPQRELLEPLALDEISSFYEERKSLFEGGYAKITKEVNDKVWQEKKGEFDGRQKSKIYL